MHIRELFHILRNINIFRIAYSNEELLNKCIELSTLKETDYDELKSLLNEHFISFASLIFSEYRFRLDTFYMIMDHIKSFVPEIIFNVIVDSEGGSISRSHLICAAFSSNINFKTAVNFCFDLIERYYNGNYFMITNMLYISPDMSLFKSMIVSSQSRKNYIRDELIKRKTEDAQFNMAIFE